MRKFLFSGVMGLLLLAVAACGASAPPAQNPTATSAPAPTTPSGATSGPQATPTESAGTSGETTLVTRGQNYDLQYVCVNRTLEPCKVIEQLFDAIRQRTEGQVDIQMTSYPELGLTGFDMLRLIKDGSVEFGEVYSGFVGGDEPAMNISNLWGLFSSTEEYLMVVEAIKEDMYRLVREKWGGEVISRNYYDSQYFFTKKPLNTVADFRGMKTRSHSDVLSDLISALGADPQAMTFAEVYPALERGVLDAGVTGGVPGYGQKWYEVTTHMTGPFVGSFAVTYLTINNGIWNSFPADIQAIIKEEGRKHDARIRQMVFEWDKEGVRLNQEAGMVYTPFKPEMVQALQNAAVESVLPRWVAKAGGPNSDAVKLYNAKVAPINGIMVNPDGTASMVEKQAMAGELPPPCTTKPTTTGQKFQFQYVNITRTVGTFPLMEEFAQHVADCTNGQVEIQLTSFPELGIAGPDTLRLIKDGTMGFGEIYPGYVGGEWPFIEMSELLGLFPDSETQLEVFAALRDEEIRIIRERFNGHVITYSYYDNNPIFSKRAIRTKEDFQGLKTRSHSVPLNDLLIALGAEPQFVAFAEVYTALERGILEAGLTAGTAGHGQKWYEVTQYLHGPVIARPHTMITMNLDQWNKLPPDFQQIIMEVGAWKEAKNLQLVTEWDQQGIDMNVAEGMEYIPFTDEVTEAIREAAIDSILPNWVNRAGGPDSPDVQVYNELVAPIVGIKVNPDGTASEIPSVSN